MGLHSSMFARASQEGPCSNSGTRPPTTWTSDTAVSEAQHVPRPSQQTTTAPQSPWPLNLLFLSYTSCSKSDPSCLLRADTTFIVRRIRHCHHSVEGGAPEQAHRRLRGHRCGGFGPGPQQSGGILGSWIWGYLLPQAKLAPYDCVRICKDRS